MKKNWLYGKTIVISGASGGLGFSIAKALIEKYDCKVIGIARNEQKILSQIQTIKDDKKSNFTYKLFDVSIKENWVDFQNYLEANNISIDVLINNAGFMLPFKKFDKISFEEIDEIVKTDFTSVVTATKILLPLLQKSASPAILNVSSAAGLLAVAGESMYCATKFAVRGFTETIQQEYGKSIYIGGIYPGFIKTDILSRQLEDAKNHKVVGKFMMPLEKATKTIVKRVSKKKKRIVFGYQARTLSFLSRAFPKLGPKLVAKVFKASKLDIFEQVF
jgi:short-subunit dehydrogenase